MDLKTFLENFEAIAEAPGGISQLRSLILDLAVRGKLVPQNPEDESAEKVLERIQISKKALIKSGIVSKSKKITTGDDNYEAFPVPSSWIWIRLEDISSYIQRGKSPKYSDSGKVLVVSQKCVQWTGFDISKAQYIQDETLPAYSSERFIKPGDLLWNSTGTGTVGRINIFPNSLKHKQVVVDSHVTVIRVIECLPEYIYCWLTSPHVQNFIDEKTSGTTNQQELNTTTVRTEPVPLPPITEQKRIVEKVDELMALCDRYEAAKQTRDNLRQKLRGSAITSLMNAETDEVLDAAWVIVRDNWRDLSQHPEDLDSLRKSVLQLAVRGKLVPQNPNDEPVEILLSQSEKQRKELLNQRKIRNQKKQLLTNELPWEIPKYWVAVPIDSVAFSYDHLRVPVNKNERNARKGNVPYYGANGQVGWIDKPLFNEDLILVVEDETFIGRTKPFSYLISGLSWVNNHAHVLKPSCAVLPKFLNYVLMYYPFAPLTSGTTGRRKLTQPTLMGVEIPLPPLNEQSKIIHKIEQLWSLCDQLEASLRLSQQRAESLAASAISHLTI